MDQLTFLSDTEKLLLHADARPLKVVVGPPEPNCVTFHAAFHWVQENPLITTIAGGLTTALITYVFKYFGGRSDEMKHLRAVAEEAIRQAGHSNEAVIQRMLDTIDRMAEKLHPALKQAVEPVGTTAATMTISGTRGHSPIVVDKPMRDAIKADAVTDVGEEVNVEVRFAEMNLDNRTCRVIFDSDPDDRVSAEITDPAFMVPGNAYALAFAAQAPLRVRAKPTLKGDIVDRWYISAYQPD